MRSYPQVTFRLPPEAKAKLKAMSAVVALPQWRVISAALECYFRARSEAEQREVMHSMQRLSGRRSQE